MDLKKTPCRYCGKKIIWGITQEGKRIPLDPSPPIYKLHSTGADSYFITREDPELVHVTHFATCPGASKASADAKERRKKDELD